MSHLVARPPTKAFQREASDLLQQIGNELQQLRQNFSIQKAHNLMRLTHTLKGAAAIVGLDVIQTATQALENAFKALCTPDASLSPSVEALIVEGYGCLKLLLSVPLVNAQINESEVVDRLNMIVAQMQTTLGNRFGQDSFLPTSAQLGVDVTHSIFESGVTEYLDELTQALVTPDPIFLKELLHIQADVFIGLGESLDLPGFGNIAQTTLAALNQHPNQVVHIAQLALQDYRAAQARILQGDRNQGGAPSQALVTLGQPLQSPPQPDWLNNFWQRLSQPRQVSQTRSIDLKMQSLGQLFQQCHEELQRLTQQQGKPIVVKIKGEDIQIEQTLANQLSAILQHLVRYAFYQDIEMPAVRKKRRKSAIGKIQLAAKQVEQHIVICVWDNGRGLNPETVRLQVQPYISALNGTITAAYLAGKGTCFTLKVPTRA